MVLFISPIWEKKLALHLDTMSTPSQRNIQSETHWRENLNVNSVIVLSAANYFCLLNGGPSPQVCPRRLLLSAVVLSAQWVNVRHHCRLT